MRRVASLPVLGRVVQVSETTDLTKTVGSSEVTEVVAGPVQ